MRCGAPDLPFIETLAWYFKQIGAVVVLVSIGVLAIASLIYAHDVIKDWRRLKMRGKQ